MMKVLKGALLLLLLAVANAKPDHHLGHDHGHGHDQCHVPKMLARDNLQTVLGDWVLVWAVSDHQESQDIMRTLISSRVEMRLQEDNQTLMFSERNRFSDKFINYYINISMDLLQNPRQAPHPIKEMEVDGVLVPYNETGSVNFYETCPNCMRIVFNMSRGLFVLNYRKEGHHQDVDHMKADHDNHRKMAECLGIKHGQPYIYDGVADDPNTELRQDDCPNFWSPFSGRCYKYFGTHTTWVQAELYCVSQGTNLVSIHSREEERFIRNLINGADPAMRWTWIGLSDVHKQGTWMWSDGSAVNSFFWAPGEPSTPVEERCVHINFAQSMDWNDLRCSDTLPSVCASRTTCP
ncbi:hypothetical protein KUCAC02_035191 [Chaenocephalus aceratus]|nr:hypothetical protein KUCAC02_035191 [Chaenocephalus aceratus]